jgi:hypothetical protein
MPLFLKDKSGNAINRSKQPTGVVSRTVTAENQFTNTIHVHDDESVAIFVSGTFSANVVLQQRIDTRWDTIKTYTEGNAERFTSAVGCDLRIGVATGGFTSGAAFVEIAKGNAR